MIPLESTIQSLSWGKSTPTKTVTKNWLDQFNMSSESTTINTTGQVTYTIYRYGMPGCASSDTEHPRLPYEQDDWDYGLLSSTPARYTGNCSHDAFRKRHQEANLQLSIAATYPFTSNNSLYYSTFASGSYSAPGDQCVPASRG